MKNIISIIMLIVISGLFAENLVLDAVSEDLRNNPNGEKIGSIMKGAQLKQLEKDGNWIKVSVEGWIWYQSVSSGTHIEESKTRNSIAAMKPVSPLGFDIVSSQPIGDKTELIVMITNAADKIIESAEVTCKALNSKKEPIKYNKQMVVKPADEDLVVGASIEYKFILDIDYSAISSFSFRLGNIVYK